MTTDRLPRWLLGALILALAGLLVGGVEFYYSQERAVRRGVEGNLYAVARLKAEQIAAWRAERRADAAVLMANAPLVESAAHWMAAPNAEDEDDLLKLFRVLQSSYHYSDVLLADMNGDARLSLSGYVGPLDPEVILPLAEAARDARPMFTDLHQPVMGAAEAAPHIGVVAPLYAPGAAEPFGAIILQASAAQYLYPLLAAWPASSDSAETLLVRREGDAALFLSPLRYAPDAALAMRIPLDETDVPAVMAAMGRVGVVEGDDYRGVRVLSALAPAPDSPWFIVAKMDKSEALAEWRSRSALILALIAGLMAALIAAVANFWQSNRRQHYRALFVAEAERRQSEERYHTTLLSIGDGVIAADAEGRVQLLNPVAEALTGWENDRAQGLPLEEVFRIVNEDTRQPVETPVARVVREGVVVGLANHTVLIARDGRERPIADSGAPIKDEAGRVTGVVLVFRDQTAERAAQEALRAQSRNLSAIIASSPIGMMVINQREEIPHANPAAERLFGARLNELEHARCGDLIGCINRRENAFGCGHSSRCHLCPIYAAIRAVLAGEQAVAQQEHEFELEASEGCARRWLRYGVEGVTLDGQPHAIVAIEDITDRKNAEETLRQREETYRALVDSVPDVIARFDREGRHLYISPNVAEFTDWDPERMIGKTHREIGSPEPMRLAWEDALARVFERGEPFETEFTLERPDGVTILDWRFVPEFDAQGRVATVLSLSRDVTRARQLEADYHTLFNSMLDGFAVHQIILDEQGAPADYRFLSVNPAFERMTGLKASDILGKTAKETLPGLESYWIETYGRVALTGEPTTFENYAQGLDKYFEVTAFQTAPGQFACIFADATVRRRAEQALRESEEQYRQLFEAESDAIILVDNDTGRILRANRAASALYGYSAEEMLALRNTDLSAEPDKTRQLMASATFTADEMASIPLRWHRKRDGTVFPVEAAGRFFEREGRRLHITAIRDITARMEAERALRESEEQYRQLFEAESDAIVLIDNETSRILRANQAACALYGYSADELLTMHNYDLSAEPQETQRVTRTTPPALDQIVTIPLRWHRKRDGTVFPVEITGRFFVREGRPVHIAAIRDITERRIAEQALRESEALYRRLADNIDDVIWTLDNDLHFTYVSPSIMKLRGLTPEEAMRETPAESMTPESFRRMQEIEGVRQFTQDPRSWEGRIHVEVEQYHKDGHTVWVEMTIQPLRGEDGQRLGYLGVSRNITERKRAEAEAARLQEQLTQALKMESVGRLAGGVAHDFNNMLQAILGHAELAMEDIEPASPVHESLSEIQRAARRSADLTRQLLAFARKQTISPQVLDLNETVGGMLKMLRRLIGEDIDLIWSPGYNLWPVRMDPSQLDQILANLCVNARDAIGDVGRITIETDNVTLDAAYCAAHAEITPGDYVMLAVSDSGCGMSKETMSHLFEPFYTTKPVGEGTGLGLATVYGIVKQNEGAINVYSEPGLGATFKIYLPRYQGAAPSLAGGEAGALRAGDETVLLVEDEAAILMMGKRMLERLGYTVLTADSPAAALATASEYQGAIHLLVTDVVMPEMNGRELAERLRSAQPSLKCLFMSGYTADVIAHRGVLEEGVQFMPKPFTLQALASHVRAALDRK